MNKDRSTLTSDTSFGNEGYIGGIISGVLDTLHLSVSIEGLISKLAWVDEPGDSGLSVGLSPSAVAVGEDTFVDVLASLELTSFSWGAVAVGEAEISSFASGTADQALLASSDVVIDACGADVVIAVSQTTTMWGRCGSTAWSAEQAEVEFLAIDIAGYTPIGGPLVLSMETTITMGGTGWGPPLTVSGNLATFTLANDVRGKDTFAESIVEALTVEDQMSLV
ncbi:MAG: hypothetical protein K0S56_3388, partial [Microvirga sp.]|nr:hypothetical protein [Microvirga sp.]